MTVGLQIEWPIEGRQPNKAMVTTPGGFSDDHLARGEREALDLAVMTGTPIVSKISGIITQSGYLGDAGNAVTTECDYDGRHYLSRDCHLYQCNVNVGDSVVAGQRIGLSGNTGLSTGPHAHSLLEIDGVRVRLEDIYFPTTIPLTHVLDE